MLVGIRWSDECTRLTELCVLLVSYRPSGGANLWPSPVPKVNWAAEDSFLEIMSAAIASTCRPHIGVEVVVAEVEAGVELEEAIVIEGDSMRRSLGLSFGVVVVRKRGEGWS